MAVPKSRTSLMKSRMRRGANRWRAPKLNKCTECGSTTPSHIACPSCGYYRNRQVLNIDSF
ncbi:MAG: 50S ribosomal protein L32 [Verrucomicrobiaceae bacterium]|nr:50S ribosomal protein L32 [Verrucomicrobiaceae bacterium]